MPTDPHPRGAGSPFAKVGECLYRHETSGVYYALVKRGGKQHRRSLKTSDRAPANRRLAVYRSEVGRLDPKAGAGRLTFPERAQRCQARLTSHLNSSSAARRQLSIKKLSEFFGTIPLRQLTNAECKRWAERRSAQIAPATFNLEHDTLRLVLDQAVREGLLLENPARGIARRKVGRRPMIIPTQTQVATLVDAIRSLDSRARPAVDLVGLLAYSGMRLREATELRREDIDLNRGTFVVTGGSRGTKNHEFRMVPLFPAMRQLLARLREAAPEADGRIIAIDDAKRAIGSACRNTGLPHFSHHTFRHYFVSNAIEAGIDFKVIAGWLGHKDGGVLVARTYGHLRDTHSFEMAERMTFTAIRKNPEQLLG